MDAPNCYCVYGLTLSSNIPLPELPLCDSGTPEQLQFILNQPAPQLPRSDWFHTWVIDGQPQASSPWLQIAPESDGFLLRFPTRADFRVSSDGRLITCNPHGSTQHSSIRHLLLDQVLPLSLSLSRHCVLHAAGVVTPQGTAIAFAATSGSGKSTLAAALVQSGCRLLTDDGLLLRWDEGRIAAVPSYPGVRLWNDSTRQLFGESPAVCEYADYTSKRRLELESSALLSHNAPVGLKALYILGNGEAAKAPEFRPLSQREAFVELIKYTFALDVKNRLHLQTGFREAEALARLPLYFRLDYPRSWDQLPAVLEAILTHAATVRT
jgi:hypothetical protein